MAELEKPLGVRLFISVLYAGPEDYERAKELLAEEFGEPQNISEEYDFNFTDYYKKETGSELKKRLLAYGIINPGKLSNIKITTNEMEKMLANGLNRTANIDPGFIGHKQVVLASAKPSPYRIYLKDGIYGQIVLVYSKHGWIELPHTFADFKLETVQKFLAENMPL